MSILDMDVTTRRNAGSVRAREFATVRKGYDPDQVRSFLDHVATWLDDLETDLASARAEAAAARATHAAAPTPAPPAPPPEPQDPYAALGTRVAELLRSAEDHAKRIRDEAEASSERMLEEARAESLRMRTRAQEEAEALRQAAQEHADVARRSAQEEADRVREEAANALETARVEAERTVAGLFERRSVLAAELHATRSRLLGIVTQLEEESEDDLMSSEPPIVVTSSEDPAVTEGESHSAARTIPTVSYIPPDDPRRDPVPADDPRWESVQADHARWDVSPPDLPTFVPPPVPPRVSIPEAEPEAIEEVTEPASIGAGDGGESPATLAPEQAPSAETVDAEPPSDDVETAVDTDMPEADSGPDGEEARPAGRGSFLRWTNEEAGNSPIDLTLPDFPSIDISSLEDESQPG